MAGFTRRFTSIPTLEKILEIEGVVVIDLAPPEPATGAGSGTVLLVGEFEDGFFATDEEADGSVEVFGAEDYRTKFGGFGFVYGQTQSQNPCARRHLAENWNGNGYLKGFKLKCSRLLVARVDTSVGSVSFDPLAAIDGEPGPYVLAVGQTLAFTTDEGSASSTALTGVAAVKVGASAALATLLSGETFGIAVDGGPMVTVAFGAADLDQAAVIARVNATLGFTCAIDGGSGQVDFQGQILGTAGSVTLTETTTGVLTKLGHTAGTASGTGTFANIKAVTLAELVAFVNGVAGLTAIDVGAQVGPGNVIRFVNIVSADDSTISIAAGAMATALGLDPLATTVSIGDHPGGTIPAGTRVENGDGDQWVTMQTLDIPEGALGPIVAKVRPALDDGTAAGAAAGDVTTIVDALPFAAVVNNAAALTAAKNEEQMDNAYIAAMDATLAETGDACEANYLLCARRSDALVRAGKANVVSATENGLFARIFVTGDPMPTTAGDSIDHAEAFRGGNDDRVFYTTKAMKVRVPAIAELGLTGGIGFTQDGVISMRPDGPLTTICATLAPEENPGQKTGLIDDFFAVDTGGETLARQTYEAWKRNGIAAPRRDRDSGMVFQSGVTLSLESGRKTMARRKMADFIQNSAVQIGKPYCKKLNTQARRDALRGVWEAFLGELQSAAIPAKSRIEAFSVDDSAKAGNTPEVLARGVYFLVTKVRTHSSMDDVVFQTEIGESTVITRQL